MLSTKFQVPNFKYQIPSTKCQAPNSKFYPLQTTDHRPNSKGAVGKRTRPKPQKPPCPGPKGWRLLWFLVRGNKFQVPNTKFQAPSTKFQIPPTTDYRPPTTDQIPKAQWGKERGRNHKNLLAPALKGGGFCGFWLSWDLGFWVGENDDVSLT